jgi:hypothetical protein
MVEAQGTRSSLSSWLRRIRGIAGWIAVVAFVSFLIPHILIERFEPSDFKWAIGAPRPPAWQFMWRNLSLAILAVAAMVSFPRWQSLVPVIIAIALIALALYGV